MRAIVASIAASAALVAVGVTAWQTDSHPAAHTVTYRGNSGAYPTWVAGDRQHGWTIDWSDGHETRDGGWEDIQRECSHDDHPAVCLTAWNVIENDYATMQRMTIAAATK